MNLIGFIVISKTVLSRRDKKLARLVEPKASKKRIALYLALWLGLGLCGVSEADRGPKGTEQWWYKKSPDECHNIALGARGDCMMKCQNGRKLMGFTNEDVGRCYKGCDPLFDDVEHGCKTGEWVGG